MVLRFKFRLVDSVTKWRRSDEEAYALDPSHRPSIDIRETQKKDLKLVDEKFDSDAVGAKFGGDDWAQMDMEVDAAIGEDSSDEDGKSDDWPDLDEEIENTLKDDVSSCTIGKRKTRDE
jgi:hypothetical protein